MYSLISHRGIYNEAVKKYIVDEESDVGSVPTDAPPGSECFVIGNSTTYMLNHKKQWIKVKLSSDNGGSDNPSTPDDPSNNESEWESM
jgi:hypothetical protein